MRDTATSTARNRLGSSHADEGRWRVKWQIEKYVGDLTLDEIRLLRRVPYDVVRGRNNLLCTAGVTNLWNGLVTSGLATPYNATNAAIAVSDGNPTALSANPTFTNGSPTVTISNTTGPGVGQSIRLNADNVWGQIASIVTNTSFTLTANYPGVGGTGAGAYILGPQASDTDILATSTAVGGAITGITNANPFVVTTTTAHGLIVGQVVKIAGVVGATGANGTWVVNAVPSGTTYNVVATAPGVWSSGGTTSLINYFRQLVSGAPTVSGNQVTFVASFGSSSANYAWNQWGIVNSASAQSGGTLLNSKVASVGTKTTGNTWVFTISITLS